MSSQHRSTSTVKDSRKSTIKSYHNRYPLSQLSPSRKRDVELWRRDQRAATREVSVCHLLLFSVPQLMVYQQAYINPDQPILTQSSSHKRPRYSAPSTPTLPSTADAFNLMPQHKRRKCSSPDPTTEYNHPAAMNLDQPRSNAFWELQKSVEESGEGFVMKMREQESRGRKRRQPMMSRTSNMINSEDEDILILSGGSLEGNDPSSPILPRKKIASSVGMMDLEPFSIDLETEDLFSSPSHTAPSISSDEDTDYPGSSTSITTHSASSPVSWSFPSDASIPHSLQLPNVSTHNKLPSSRSDKAIAALTLALANGAGDLNDYGPLLDDSSLVDYQVGELWK